MKEKLIEIINYTNSYFKSCKYEIAIYGTDSIEIYPEKFNYGYLIDLVNSIDDIRHFRFLVFKHKGYIMFRDDDIWIWYHTKYITSAGLIKLNFESDQYTKAFNLLSEYKLCSDKLQKAFK